MEKAAQPQSPVKSAEGGSETKSAEKEDPETPKPVADRPGPADRPVSQKRESIDLAKSMVIGLLFECPMGKAEDDCVFGQMRKVTNIQDGKCLLESVAALSSKDRDKLITRHRRCLMKRECVTKQK